MSKVGLKDNTSTYEGKAKKSGFLDVKMSRKVIREHQSLNKYEFTVVLA